MGWKGVLTNGGNAILAQWSGGGHTLTIDKATVGSGSVAEANMRTQTALNNYKMDASIVGYETVSDGVKFRVRVTAAPALVGTFTGHEIGIWAHLDSGTTTLISYHMDAVTGIPVPLDSVSPEFKFDLLCTLAIDNSGTLNVTVTPGVFLTQSDFETAVYNIIAPDYDNTATYSLGAYCIHEMKLWKCTTAITTAEEWDATHWTLRLVEETLVDHEDRIANAESDITGLNQDIAKLEESFTYVIDGNQCASSVTAGHYVYLKNSTITGCTDGPYIAAQAIPANTDLTSAYLTAVPTGGVANSLYDNKQDNPPIGAFQAASFSRAWGGRTCDISIPYGNAGQYRVYMLSIIHANATGVVGMYFVNIQDATTPIIHLISKTFSETPAITYKDPYTLRVTMETGSYWMMGIVQVAAY